jgi:CRP/FNR family transcriptional regulator
LGAVELFWELFVAATCSYTRTITEPFEEGSMAASAAKAAVAPVPSGRKVPCEKCPLRPLECLREFTASELEFVSRFKSGELNVQAGTSILLQSTNSPHLYTVLSGWAFRYKTLPDGRRQILNYGLPSDLIGLQGSVNDEMQHSVEALTDVMLCVFPREKLWELYSNYPTLAFDITWIAAREEQILDEGLLNVGRRTAMERLAHLLLVLFQRAEEVGLTKGNSIQFPFTQQHVADTLGMSLVHTNKTLQKLTATKTVRWKERRFDLLDREALAEIANYERPEPRARRPFI